jgi:hypothetical protein
MRPGFSLYFLWNHQRQLGAVTLRQATLHDRQSVSQCAGFHWLLAVTAAICLFDDISQLDEMSTLQLPHFNSR